MESVDDRSISTSTATLLSLWALNLLAAYGPALLYVPGMAGTASFAWKFLFSPVLLIGLFLWATDPLVGWSLLLVFWGMLGVISALLNRSRKGRTAMPLIVAAYSVLQGYLALSFINGIDAIGHS